MAARQLTRRTFLIGAAGTVAAIATGCATQALLTPSPRATAGSTPTLPPTPEATQGPSPSPSGAVLSLRQRAAALLVVGFRGRRLASIDPIMRAIAEEGLGGVILFARNVESPDQLAELTGTLGAAAGGQSLLICVDQEGGAVARLTAQKGFTDMPSAADVGATGDAAVALEAGRAGGAMLAAAGINMNLAPVVDVNVNPANPSIGALERSFSADPAIVAEMAAAFIDGHREHGVLTSLKHFPGLGSATGNTDREFVDVTTTWTDQELEPFRALIASGHADSVMVGNMLNGQIDRRAPATLSEPTLTLLREDLGFAGPQITDDLQAGALLGSYTEDGILRRALVAGNDLLLFAATGRPERELVPRLLDTIENLVEEGRVSEARIDEAFARRASLFTG